MNTQKVPFDPQDIREKPRWTRRSGKHFVKHRRRTFQQQHLQRNTNKKSPTPRNRNSIERRRNALHNIQKANHRAAARETGDLLIRIHNFSQQLVFRPYRPGPPVEEGEERNKGQTVVATSFNHPFNDYHKRTHHYRRHNRSIGRRQKLTTKYRPIGPTYGLTTTQLNAMHSPAATAYMANFYTPTGPLRNISHAVRATMSAAFNDNTSDKKENRFPVIWDSGASISISFSKKDFIGNIKPSSVGMKLQGIAKGVSIAGQGNVAWAFVDTKGKLRTLKVPALYVPKAKARLLSTSSLLAQYPEEMINIQSNRLLLSKTNSNNSNTNEHPIEILTDSSTNLPVGYAYAHTADTKLYQAMNSTISTVSRNNMNLSEPQKELLRWHNRLGHLSYKRIQFLMRSGVLAHTESARRLQSTASKIQHPPLCAACQFGKQRRRTSPGTKRIKVEDRDGVLKEGNLFPGQKVSVDHFICSTRGRLTSTYGKENTKDQYHGGALFVDHASGYIFVNEQVHLNTHETIKSKEEYEKHCRDFGVIPQTYLSDNHSTFTSAEYSSHLEKPCSDFPIRGSGSSSSQWNCRKKYPNGHVDRPNCDVTRCNSLARCSRCSALASCGTTLSPPLQPHAKRIHRHQPT